MEQNLSEKERKQRLVLGLSLLTVALASYVTIDNIYLTTGLAIAATGFIANYFTCFCGTKKLLNKLGN